MSLKRFAAKRDATEKDIVKALRKAGAKVLPLDKFDMLVLRNGELFMLDAKSPSGRATKAQEALIAEGWPLRYVKTPIEALKATEFVLDVDDREYL